MKPRKFTTIKVDVNVRKFLRKKAADQDLSMAAYLRKIAKTDDKDEKQLFQW